jgi:hypothetical protein
MKRFKSAIVLSLPAWILAGGGAAPAVEVENLLQRMPADWPVTIVLTHPLRLDASIAALQKRLDPSEAPEGMLAGLKRELGIGDWIDFNQPFGMAAQTFGNSGMPVVWAAVKDAESKLKSAPGAQQDGAFWRFKPGEEEISATVQGEFLVLAPDRESLEKATKKENRSLAEEVRGRTELYKDRDVFVHASFEPLREAVLGHVAQITQMAPMFAMMAAQSGGMSDPSGLVGLITTAGNAARRLLEQLDYLEASAVLGNDVAQVTLATGYREGAIQKYLVGQKPASIPLLMGLEDQPYLLAVGYHLPGKESPVVDYFVEEMRKNVPPAAAPAPVAAPGTPAPAGGEATASPWMESLKVTQDLYRKIEGMSTTFMFSPEGMRSSGEYIGSDPAGIVELTKKTMTMANSIMAQFQGGATYESTGKKKIGDTEVEMFGIKVDPASPQAAHIKMMFGENTRYALGASGGKVRYCLGKESDIERVFQGSSGPMLGANPKVKETVARLPEKRTGMVLVNLLNIGAFVATMQGAPPPAAPPAAAPVALSFTLAGHPARVDACVPLDTLQQFVQMLNPPPTPPPAAP